MRLRAATALGLAATVAVAEPVEPDGDTVAQCLSCHLIAEDRIDIVGLSALEGLPEEWQFLFEDAFDLDGDGIAGAMRFVSGQDGPRAGLFGQALAAGRFEDFALIAAGAHGIAIESPEEMARIRAAFEARSPDPAGSIPDPDTLRRFEARGCADCHVTRRFEHDGAQYMPLSDFLLHDLGDGPRRTAPLWGCLECLSAPAHAPVDSARPPTPG